MTAWLDDGDVRIYHGDALEQLALMPTESVQCIVTSPPFFSLRDYGVEGQIGLEDSAEAWCSRLVDVFREARRVLRSDGCMWLEVGDAYAGGGIGGGPKGSIDGAADFRADERTLTASPGAKPKDLLGCPWLLAFALRADGWYLRSDTIWARPNPMPESVTDRPTKAHSYVFLLTKSARYFFDADAIREPHDSKLPMAHHAKQAAESERTAAAGMRSTAIATGPRVYNPAGRNARSVWSIPTEPTPFAHFATFPQALVERCIKAGTSEHGACSECGAPWRRITERGIEHTQKVHNVAGPQNGVGRSQGAARHADGHVAGIPHVTTLGWEQSCGCYIAPADREPRPRADRPPVAPCVVLDPFMGSGTTALVARRLNRHAIGIELNPEYLAIAAERLQQPTLWSDLAPRPEVAQ